MESARGSATSRTVITHTATTSRGHASHIWQVCVALLATVAMTLGMACVAPAASAASADGAVSAAGAATTWSSLSSKLKKSTYGFFLWRAEHAPSQIERDTARDAANILVNSALPKTKLTGEKGSATNLDNAIQAAKALVKVNEYRSTLTNEPCRTDLPAGKGRACSDASKRLTPYVTSDTFMAMSQVNADFAAPIWDHASRHGQSYASRYNLKGSTEILATWAWIQNDGMPQEAIDFWYGSEKPAYDSDPGNGSNQSKYEHYLIFTNKWPYAHYQEYKIAGFGYNTVYDAADAIDAMPAWAAASYTGFTQTAQSYVADIEAYKQVVDAALASPKSAVKTTSVSTAQGIVPYLPATMQVTWANGDKTQEPVTWDAVPASSYAKKGTFTVKGRFTNAMLATRFGTLTAKVTVNDYYQMFRLYNPNSGEHFYTAAVVERNSLVSLGWHDEGIGWLAPLKSNTPVYRLYNPNAGDHHYTTSAAERDYLVKAGWNDEGIGWYSAENSGRMPLYRQYNPNAKSGAHNFTLNTAERDNLVHLGWHDEGTAWYAVNGSTR